MLQTMLQTKLQTMLQTCYKLGKIFLKPLVSLGCMVCNTCYKYLYLFVTYLTLIGYVTMLQTGITSDNSPKKY